MLAGLVRYDEVQSGVIGHALRFTVSRTQRAYIHPATHFASSYTDPDLPPMGLRLRLKSSVDISGFPRSVQVVLQALKTHGMIVADNGGDFYISGAPDPRWNDDELHQIAQILGRDFEVVDTRSARPTTTTTARPTMTTTAVPAAPQVAFLAPVDGAAVPQGRVSVNVQASSAKGMDRVQFYVDARAVATDRTAPYSFTWNATRVPAGLHVLSVRAFDRAGRVASASIQVRVSRTVRAGMQQ